MSKEQEQHYSNNLKRYRRSFGYDRAIVARLVGLKKTKQLVEWERGASLPDLVSFFRLCHLYKGNPIDLYSDLFQAVGADMQEQLKSPLPTIEF